MNLKAVLEGMLFVAGDDGLSVENLINVLEVDKETLKKIISFFVVFFESLFSFIYPKNTA